MRTYRLEIRLIQTAVILAVLVTITGILGLWGNTNKQDSGSNSQETQTMPGSSEATKPVEETNPKIVAIGDSFTNGYPVGEDHSWTVQLEKELQVKNSQVQVINKGLSQQTAKDLLDRFDEDVIAEKPGKVIIFVGTGDALHDVPIEDFQSNIESMVDKCNANHITPILALPMLYPGVSQSIQTSIADMREWEMSYAMEQKITTLDFSSVIFDAEGNPIKDYFYNANYPNEKGYEEMGNYAANVFK